MRGPGSPGWLEPEVFNKMTREQKMAHLEKVRKKSSDSHTSEISKAVREAFAAEKEATKIAVDASTSSVSVPDVPK